ncbi:MAG: putative bifunctional diguanylate cyclase/phosphodiesterase [Actinomycetes bacterium]
MSSVDTRNRLPTLARHTFLAYLTTVIASGALLGLLGLVGLGVSGLTLLLTSVAFWVALVLVVFGDVRPLFLPGLGDPTGIATSLPFAFAGLLYLGFTTAALLMAIGVVVTGVVRKRAWFRTAFNIGQYTISLAAASGVLAVFGYHASPQHPHVPAIADLPVIVASIVAYFVVNNSAVTEAVALMQGDRFWPVLMEDLAYQAAATGALLLITPLLAVCMGTAPALLPLFLVPLLAFYKNAEISLAREREAQHDSLTGLANRALLLERAERLLQSSERNGGALALFLLDLDRFKEVNDTLGHPVGDRVLQVVAERLESSLRNEDMVARLGGDEFAVLLPDTRLEPALTAANRIREAIADPISIDGLMIDLDASIGIALHPDHGDTVEQLHQRADVAMYLAKFGRTGVEVYQPEKDLNSPERLGLLGTLRRALELDELVLHFQPKIDACDGRITGVEALVRWMHPARGLVMPDDFIPLAEDTGLMPRLTDAILEQALRQAAAWESQGIPVPVAVNIRVRDLADPGFTDRVFAGLERWSLPAKSLVLEITERVGLEDLETGRELLGRLRARGIKVSLDDFGTGYSSLTLLTQLPVSEVKIDRSFVARVEAATEATVVRSIVGLAHGLGLRVVAEGVDTADILHRLCGLGCDEAQGWLIGRPMPAEAMTAWLDERRSRLVAVGDSAAAPELTRTP